VTTRFVNIYQNVVLGVIFELLWLPMILLALSLPFICLYFLFKEKFSVKSAYFWAILIMAIGFLVLYTFRFA
jgi:hypothetical protein